MRTLKIIEKVRRSDGLEDVRLVSRYLMNEGLISINGRERFVWAEEENNGDRVVVMHKLLKKAFGNIEDNGHAGELEATLLYAATPGRGQMIEKGMWVALSPTRTGCFFLREIPAWLCRENSSDPRKSDGVSLKNLKGEALRLNIMVDVLELAEIWNKWRELPVDPRVATRTLLRALMLTKLPRDAVGRLLWRWTELRPMSSIEELRAVDVWQILAYSVERELRTWKERPIEKWRVRMHLTEAFVDSVRER